MTLAQKRLAVERIRSWPRAERVFVTRLPEREAEIVGLLVAELDVRPVPPLGGFRANGS